jgi:hypothetical protein
VRDGKKILVVSDPGFVVRVGGNIVEGKILLQVFQQKAPGQAFHAAFLIFYVDAQACFAGKKTFRFVDLPDGGQAVWVTVPFFDERHGANVVRIWEFGIWIADDELQISGCAVLWVDSLQQKWHLNL